MSAILPAFITST